MSVATIVDAGPLVAFLNREDAHHHWVKEQLAQLTRPLLTCEAALAEAWHLLGKAGSAQAAILELMRRDTLRVAFELGREVPSVERLIQRYASVPMSLADACLVRMTEIHSGSRVLTLDSDFHIYRRHGRQIISLIIPEHD